MRTQLTVKANSKLDAIAFAATLTMFLGVFLSSSTAVGPVLIGAGALVMLLVLLHVVRRKV